MNEVRLGTRRLQPHRQLLADGERLHLGKRALDILSVLAEANGGIVTKDELLNTVWPGVFVEENALQVHIVALRKALGPDAGRLRTIRGVGYQLDIASHSAEDLTGAIWFGDQFGLADDAAAPVAGLRSTSVDPVPALLPGARSAQVSARSGMIALAALLLLFAGGALALAVWPMRQGGDVIRVEPLGSSGGEPARLLAQTLHGDIMEVLNESRIQLASGNRRDLFSPARRANRVLHGNVTQSDGRIRATLVLEDIASGTTLWSKQFERDTDAQERLATEASAAVARTIYAVQETRQQRGQALDPATIALYVRGVELIRDARLLEEGAPRQIFEQVVARAPDSAIGHAQLAISWVGEVRRSEPETRARLFANGRNAAQRAIAIEPAAAGSAYDALYYLARIEHPRQIGTAEDWLLAGMRNAPANPWVHMRECQLLMGVGRIREAVPLCQRAMALHPYAEPIAHNYARALSLAGEDRLSAEAIRRAAVYNPDHGVTRQVRFELAAFDGRYDEALALLADPETRPMLRRREGEVLTRYLKGAGHWDDAERQALAAEFSGMALHGEIDCDLAIMALVALGDIDAAFALLGAPAMEELLGIGKTYFLFRPLLAPLRADPRFGAVAADLGLARHWALRGRWPDLCRDEVAPDFCHRQTAQAMARHR